MDNLNGYITEQEKLKIKNLILDIGIQIKQFNELLISHQAKIRKLILNSGDVK